jgi:predicted nucleic acid-binding protein
MLVVADASPLNILIRLGYALVLPELFQTVLIPVEVAAELRASGAPESVRHFMTSPPSWLEIRVVENPSDIPGLDRGETAAIQLADQVRGDLLLMDEAAGRRTATQRGLRVIGALGILELASSIGLLSLPEAVHKLRNSDFHISDELVEAVLNRQSGSKLKRAT